MPACRIPGFIRYIFLSQKEVKAMSKKAILDVVLLVLTAGIMLAKAAYETDFPSKIDGWTE